MRATACDAMQCDTLLVIEFPFLALLPLIRSWSARVPLFIRHHRMEINNFVFDTLRQSRNTYRQRKRVVGILVPACLLACLLVFDSSILEVFFVFLHAIFLRSYFFVRRLHFWQSGRHGRRSTSKAIFGSIVSFRATNTRTPERLASLLAGWLAGSIQWSDSNERRNFNRLHHPASQPGMTRRHSTFFQNFELLGHLEIFQITSPERS